MFEYFLSPKNVKQNMIDSNQLAELLVKKDFELKQAMECLKEQETLQSKIDLLKKINKEYDDELQKLQQNFKEAVVIMVCRNFLNKKSRNKKFHFSPGDCNISSKTKIIFDKTIGFSSNICR